MSLSRHIVVSFAAVLGLGGLALASSTSCGPSIGSNPYPTWDASPPSVSVVAYAICNAKELDVSYDETLMGEAADRVAKGENDIPLSPPKAYPGSGTPPVSCVHLRLERDGAQNVTQRRLVYLNASKDYTQLLERVYYKLQKTEAGWVEELDSNGDGVPEQTEEMSYDGAGAWTGSVTTTYSGVAKTPVRRYTSAPKDELTSVLRVETWNGTTWNLESDRDVARDQAKCVTKADLPPAPAPTGSKTPGCKVVTCTQEQTDAIKRGMKTALRKVENCAPVWLTSKPAAEVAAGGIQPVCMSGSSCPLAEVDADGTADAKNPRPMRVNVNQFGSEDFTSDIFHELIHVGIGDRGKHDDLRQDLAMKLGKGLLADPTYACTAMCFPPKGYKATACDCAACIGDDLMNDGTRKKATRCSPTCSRFADCNTNNNPPLPSPDTGAYCSRMGVFCDTVSECEGSCPVAPSSCGPRDKQTNLPKQEGGNMSAACNRACD